MLVYNLIYSLLSVLINFELFGKSKSNFFQHALEEGKLMVIRYHKMKSILYFHLKSLLGHKRGNIFNEIISFGMVFFEINITLTVMRVRESEKRTFFSWKGQ